MNLGDPLTTPVTPARAAVPGPVVLGRYHLGCELASGGMATVYLALPVDASVVARPLALKRIHPHLATEREFIEMFIDEARIASRLHHPNLCGVLDFGEADGTYYMTMEYLVGEPLNRIQQALCPRPDLVPSARLSRAAAQIVADAAEGLHAAHELRDDDGEPMNIVHRDVSPSNIFITYDGHTRVVDFGIASAADRLHHTATGNVKGKFGYMPPEQMRAEKVDRRADVWSLGIVLWESIALRRLFRRENASLTVLATLEGHVPPLHEAVPGVDPALTAIVNRAVARDPEARYPTALAMAEDLQRFLATSGAPNARAEVASLVRAVFPTGESEKRKLVKTVVEERRTLERTSSPSETNPSLGSVPESGVVVKTPPAPAPTVQTWHSERASVVPGVVRGRRVPSPGRIAFGLGAALVAGATAWFVKSEQDAPGSAVRPAPPMPPIARMPSSIPPPVPAHDADAAAPVVLTNAAEAPHAPDVAAAPPVATLPEPAPTPRATAARHIGVVSIFTQGDWAQVYYRGRLLGPTPGRFSLPEGRQTLTLRPGSGGTARTVVVEVRADQTVHVRTEL